MEIDSEFWSYNLRLNPTFTLTRMKLQGNVLRRNICKLKLSISHGNWNNLNKQNGFDYIEFRNIISEDKNLKIHRENLIQLILVMGICISLLQTLQVTPIFFDQE